MKRLFNILLLCEALGFVFASCSKDEDFNPNSFSYDAAMLYGTWHTNSYLENLKFHQDDITITFNADGSFVGTGIAFLSSYKSKYRFDGDYIYLGDYTMIVGKLSSEEMTISWWYGDDDIEGMRTATFTKQ